MCILAILESTFFFIYCDRVLCIIEHSLCVFSPLLRFMLCPLFENNSDFIRGKVNQVY